MTALNWERDKARQVRRSLQREARRERTGKQWANTLGKEQERLLTLVRSHRTENGFYESVASQLDAGRSITKRQAATLLAIAQERGWRTAA